ncbi:TetR/AcrR family transcriptional regulator [[Clostridium] hylemonae]|uniref:TetR/AcrR family transcriptional regulator n=1 Tax=[Clostridium] hylemonae TaxID=89153 RepID=UPI001D061FE6|nr:TetR/AcrR family transcriptional regulator [[Clostridium] hylemonae]MCB7521948.1 TetR/AcrR family transcriptional regulator [[Clostridium] hylemonae]
MDLRMEKTEKGIKNAFIELRSRKPLERITVKELCAGACINKSTFYAHYRDIYDLSDTMEAEIAESVTNSISHPEYIIENPAVFTQELFLAYQSQSSLTNTVFSGDQSSHLSDRIEESVKKMLFEKYPQHRGDMMLDIVLSYCIQGAYHAFHGNRRYDADERIAVIGRITDSIRPLYEEYYLNN